MKKKIFNNKTGFALLYAILLSGTVLVVGVLLMNIITKQLVYSSIGKNSEMAYYYVANSIRECVYYQDYVNNAFTAFQSGVASVKSGNPSFSCPGGDLTFSVGNKVAAGSNIYKYSLSGQSLVIGGHNYKVDVDVYRNYGCENQVSTACLGSNLYNRNSTVIIVSGYSPSGPRGVKRTAVRVVK